MVSNQYLEFSVDKCDTLSSSKTPQKVNLTNASIKGENRVKLRKKAEEKLLELSVLVKTKYHPLSKEKKLKKKEGKKTKQEKDSKICNIEAEKKLYFKMSFVF